jgi:uncharacterized membrane protein YdjX (TVP38/TMEM64 family)
MNSAELRKYLFYFAVSVAAFSTVFFMSSFVLCGIIKGSTLCQWWPHISVEHIVEYIRSSGLWGVAVSIVIMVLHSFVPFPAELVAIANGMIYGTFWGAVITWTGAMIGAFLAFFLSRKFGRPFVRRLLNEKSVQGLDAWIYRYGDGTLLISRFIPIIAFNLINYAAGLTCVSWWTFAWTTGVGILPMTILMVALGVQIDALPWQVWPVLFIAAFILWPIANRMLRRSSAAPLPEKCVPPQA